MARRRKTNPGSPTAEGPDGTASPHRLASTATLVRDAVHEVRARFCRVLGIPPEGRPTVVASMLEGHGRDSGSYWLQLVLSVGIATFGLIASSTGVVIGAMLVSPLMNPMMHLGMGLTTGSAVLVLRAAFRFAMSLVVVVGGAALLQGLMPYDVLTPEIAARTAPTLLDLFVAVACAFAGAFAAIRQGLETATTAAGVAIGIALVPPLCVVGIGLAMGDLAAAGGAALLFTANFVAIIAVSGLLFLLLGFDEVKVRELELASLTPGRRISRFVHFIWRFLGTRSGIVLRIALPVVFVGAAAVPLSHALSAVAWQIRTRTELEQIVQRKTATLPTVQTRLVVERGHAQVRLVVLGSAATAATLREGIELELSPEVRAASTIEVMAVPDASALAAVAGRVDAVAEPPPLPPAPSAPAVALGNDAVAAALAEVWPVSAGEATRWDSARGEGDRLRLSVTHTGASIGIARELLERMLAQHLEVPVELVERMPPAVAYADADAGLGWLPALADALAFVATEPGWSACVTMPIEVVAVVPADVEVGPDDTGTGSADGDASAAQPDAGDVVAGGDAATADPDAVIATATPSPTPEAVARQERMLTLREVVRALVVHAGDAATLDEHGAGWRVAVVRGTCADVQ